MSGREARAGRRWLARVLLSGIAAAHAVLLYRLFAGEVRNSDAANNLLAAADIAHGNRLLSGWLMAPDNYIPEDLLFYVVGVWLAGLRPVLLYVVPAFTWAALTLTCAVLVLRRTPWPSALSGLLVVATLMGLPVLAGNPEMTVISQVPVHFVTVLYGLLCFLLADAMIRARPPGAAAAAASLCALIAMAAFGDPMALPITVAPLMLAALLFGVGRVRPWRQAAVAGSVVAGLVVARIALRWVEAAGGFEATRIEARFADFWHLGFNLALAIQTLFAEVGANIFGKALNTSPTDGAAIGLLRLPFVLLMLAAAALAGARLVAAWRAPRDAGAVRPRDGDYLDLLLLSAFVFTIAAMVSSSVTFDIYSRRYMIPSVIYGTALLARNVPSGPVLRGYLAAAAVGSAVFTAAALAHTPRAPVFVVPQQAALIARLEALGVDEGFGPYWDSSIVTVVTRGRVRILAVQPSGAEVRPYLWFMPRQAYAAAAAKRDGRFVVIVTPGTDPSLFTEAQALGTFGRPVSRETVGDYVLDVFDRAGRPLDAMRP
jgi:hypothetical protein